MARNARSVGTGKSAAKARKTEDARARLLCAGLSVFGRYGFEPATTRMLADTAQVNLSAIPYYFGGKEGLYHAVVQSITDAAREKFRPTLEAAGSALDRNDLTQSELLDLLGSLVSALATLIFMDQATSWAPIIVREQLQPTAAFSIMFEGFMRPAQELCSRIISRYLGTEADAPETIIRAHSIFGQVIVFLIARNLILRRLGRDSFTQPEIETIRRLVSEQAQAVLQSAETRAS